MTFPDDFPNDEDVCPDFDWNNYFDEHPSEDENYFEDEMREMHSEMECLMLADRLREELAPYFQPPLTDKVQ